MLSVEECRRLMGREDLTDEEIAEFLRDLETFLRKLLDDYFRDEFAPDDV